MTEQRTGTNRRAFMKRLMIASGATAVAGMGGVATVQAVADDGTGTGATPSAEPTATPTGGPGGPGGGPPGGESWRQAVDRAGRFLADLPSRWPGTRILVIGHVATRWAFDHVIDGKPLEDRVNADFGWREGWEYRLD